MWNVHNTSVPKHVLIQNIDRILRSQYHDWKSAREDFARNYSRNRHTRLEDLSAEILEVIFVAVDR